MRLAPLALLAAAAGCRHTHLPRNAPGNVDPLAPPQAITAQRTEEPEDPGERMVVASGGVFLGGGASFGEGGEPSGAAAIGAELTLQWGCSPHSHFDDSIIWPITSTGLNLGWTFVDDDGGTVGPLYATVQHYRELVGLAGGWAYDPDDGDHGPQVDLLWGPMYLRVVWLTDRDPELHLGFVLKGAALWVWSQ